MPTPVIREDWIKREELVTLSLRQLYERFGYKKYKMSSFEAYDLYLDNKTFLRDKNIITFNDASGQVLALKPDVTLSIAKNTRATADSTEKLYYLEDIYRFDKHSRAYRQINQLGLECFGRLDAYLTCEVLRLAAFTLREIGENWVMTLSHTGFVLKFLEDLGIPTAAKGELTECIRQKNAHGLRAQAAAYQITPAAADMLVGIIGLSGSFSATLEKARALAITRHMTEALDQLEGIYALMEKAGFGDRMRLDFSLINDVDYYSGIVFQGFVEDVPRAVLAGGYYGGLMRKFGRELDAIGFAVYLNELTHRLPAKQKCDVDALALYGDSEDYEDLIRATESLMAKGLRVRVERTIPAELVYDKLYSYADGALREVD